MRNQTTARRAVGLLLTTAVVATLTVVGAAAVDVSSPSVPAAAAAPVAGGLGFTALSTPCRVADTRTGGGPLTAGSIRTFQVGGTGSLAGQGGNAAGCGVPDGVGAVEVAVTAVAPTGTGYFRVFAAGDQIPNATFVNYTSGISITNTGTVPLAPSGTQDLAVANFSGTTHIVLDVLGFFAAGGTGATGYVPLASPCRAVDTRVGGGPLTTGVAAGRDVQLTGSGAAFTDQGGPAGGCGVPDAAVAAEVSITAAGPVGSGFLRAGPANGSSPAATVVNYTDGVGITNTGALPLGNVTSADLSLKNFGTQTQVVVDVLGYFTAVGGSRYQTVTPCRVVDTRSAPGGAFEPSTARAFQVGGTRGTFVSQGTTNTTGCGVPQRAAAVAATVTAVSPSGSGFARLYPSGTAANGTFLNFTAGRSISNAGVLPLARSGLRDLTLRNFGTASNFVVDVMGYYEPSAEFPNPVETLAEGDFHSCQVAVFGTVRCRGRNTFGQLGDGTFTNRTALTTVTGLSGAVAVAAGSNHSCALMSSGTVRCWGAGAFGQLGLGNTDNSSPQQVVGLANAVSLSVSGNRTCVVVQTGTVKCWGAGGAIGDGTDVSRSTPTDVLGVTGAAAVSVGEFHTCALLSTGTAKCWGNNGSGQLGDGTSGNVRRTAVDVAGLSGITTISAGLTHTCATVRDGSTRCWGDNSNGQLGDGTTTNRTIPVTVAGLAGATAVTAGSAHSCAHVDGGLVRCWGLNSQGQLGDGTLTQRTSPSTVVGVSGATAVYSGRSSDCASLTDGSLKCWGNNFVGQLGDGTTTDRSTPVLASGLSGVVSVTSGALHTCELLAEGTAKCWGNNAVGQLGDGSTTNRSAPVTVSGLAGAVALSAGSAHTCALLADGSARCWGANGSGQLGDGTTTNRSAPVTVSGLTGAVDLATGQGHSCALLEAGTLRCWGANGNGQLGDGTTTARPTPVAVNFGTFGFTSVVATGVALGRNHTCATMLDGAVGCWGDNTAGQLGDGTTSSSGSPLKVRESFSSQSSLFTALSADLGTTFGCARVVSQDVVCWGANQLGELGNLAPGPQPATAVVGSSGTAVISVGGLHACSLLNDAAVRCWGANGNGQLGDGTTVDRSSPTGVTGLSGVLGLSAGDTHTCALLVAGAVLCWGANGSGQLGDGTVVTRVTPTAVTGP